MFARSADIDDERRRPQRSARSRSRSTRRPSPTSSSSTATNVIDAVRGRPRRPARRSRSIRLRDRRRVERRHPANFCNGTVLYNTVGAVRSRHARHGEHRVRAPSPPPGQCLDTGTPRAIVKPAAGAARDQRVSCANPAGTGTDAAQEWFEITNTSTAAFDLNGLGLKGNAATGNAINSPDCKSIAPGGFALFAHLHRSRAERHAPRGRRHVHVRDRREQRRPCPCSTARHLLDTVTWTHARDRRRRSSASRRTPASPTTTTDNDKPDQLLQADRRTDATARPLNHGTPRAANVCL